MFAHPLMLAWSAAAAVPLVLRLVGRAADRTVDFSAMLFLPGGASAVASGAGRMRDWVLLAVRSAALGLLAVAIARPILPADWSAVPTAGLAAADRATIALVIDDAAGTGYARDGPARFDLITQVGLGVLAGLGRGDRATVVPEPPPIGWSDGRPSGDLSAAATALSSLRPTRRPADLAAALDRAADLLADTVGPREVVVLCDREAVAWRGVTDGFGRRWRGRSPPRVIVVPVGGEESDNVAVESVRAVGGPLVRDVPGAVRVTVRNWGVQPRANLPLSVWTGPRQLADTTVSLPPLGTVAVDVPVRLGGEEGERLISAAVRSTGLSFDDRRDGVVDVVPPARVLVVTDDAAAAGPLAAALAPNASAGRGGADPAVVTVVTAAGWGGVERERYDVVVLADVGEVTASRADDLRQFVDDGGGVLIAPGRHVLAGDYDDELGDEGVGLLPAELSSPRPAGHGGPLRLLDAAHAPFDLAGGAGADGAGSVRFEQAFGIVGRPEGKVLATIDNRPAAVAADEPDGGRVVLLTVPLDDTWGRLTGTDLFQPMVRSAVQWLAWGTPVTHEQGTGHPIVLPVDGVVDGVPFAQSLPAGRRDPLRVVRLGARTELRYERTVGPGTYRLRYRVGGRERTAFVVVTPPVEASDLTPLSARDWRELARRVRFDRADPTPAAVLAAVARGRGGPEGWAVGIGGVLLLLIGETLLGRRWSGAAERRVG